MKRTSRLDYAYAVGRVRALERKLVERAVFSEAAEEKDFPRAIKIVFDAGEFLEEMAKIKNSEELDSFLDREEKELLSLVTEILLEKDVLEAFLVEKMPEKALKISESMNYSFIHDYFRHKIDLANLKIFCRLKYSGASREKLEKSSSREAFWMTRSLSRISRRPSEMLGRKSSLLPMLRCGIEESIRLKKRRLL